MYPSPHPRFLAALAESHVPVTVVEMHWPDGTVEALPVIGGSVTVDRGSAVRRTATVEVADRGLLPQDAAGFLRIAGARIRVRRGLRIDGEAVTVPVFTGRIDDVDGDPDIGPVSITASGLEAQVANARFESPYSTRTATAAVASITTLIRSVIPDATVTATAPNSVLGPRTWDAQTDRWEAVREIATAVGAECFADADGVFRVEPLPDLLTAEVAWEVAAGEGGVLVEATAGWSRDGLYNVVVASGENSEADAPPVSATAADTDTSSPTWVGGPFGRVPRFYSSPTLNSVSRCQEAAAKLLVDAKRPSHTADLAALPNPLLEPGDVIRAVYASGHRTLHQVHSLSLDLGVGGAMTVQMIGGKEDG